MTPIPEYITPQTRLPPYLPFARFLLKTDLSLTARLVYTLLLDRTTLSQKNGWTDECGHTFILYPLEKIAEDLDRSKTSVKSALTELAAQGLIEKRRAGFSGPNQIYVMLPDGQGTGPGTVGDPPLIQPENCPSYSRKTDPHTAGKLAVNHLSNNQQTEPTERTTVRASFGRYENVFLTQAEYSALLAECPGVDRLIQQLSAYMKSSGKAYADHAATLRLWHEREKPKLPDYTPKEGESL